MVFPARATDPISSHNAARQITSSGKRARQTLVVARIVELRPGYTSCELGHLCKKDPSKARHVFARRLPEALELGLITRAYKRHCTITGHLAYCWWPKTTKVSANGADD